MTTFENIKSQWENQPEPKFPNNGSKQIIEKLRFLKNKQLILNVILGLTVLILIVFFFYISAYNNTLVAFGLSLMVGSLLIRIFVEQLSIGKLKKMNITVDTNTFKQKMIDYYKKRIKIHYILTPVIMISYVVGFIILLPFFKEALSVGFYTYVKVSSAVLLVFFIFFIRYQIQKELSILRELSN